MKKMNLDEYREYVKQERSAWFKTPYDLVYENFIALGYDKVGKQYFKDNASEIVEKLREYSWTSFVPKEREFTSNMLLKLVDEETIKSMNGLDAIIWFTENFPDHIYALTLSNTQSRRSRAGKEFESIIELLLMGAGIPMDSQGNIGKQMFVNKGLGKLVDVVSPGVVEFAIDKNDTVLISAKTTLRERWQEVPEEMGRTGAKEMFLATLDENASEEVLNTLYEANIRIVTTKRIKEKYYSQNKRVLDFEKLIEICSNNYAQWDFYTYNAQALAQMSRMIEVQTEKHSDHGFVLDYYRERMNKIKDE